MARHQHYPAPRRTVAALTDARDLRATITAILGVTPIDEAALRQSVWTYVGTERDAGISPGLVIMALTELLRAATIEARQERELLTRDAILWCVEAYFGHLGGDVFRLKGEDQAVLSPVSVSR
jgi:hypothetical protein